MSEFDCPDCGGGLQWGISDGGHEVPITYCPKCSPETVQNPAEGSA
jgi:predicted RNA-binding Zn-ribbon protein involved in translation (DUF1610 family)